MKLRRYEQAGAVFTEDLSNLSYVRKKYTVSGNPTIVDSAYGKAMSFIGATPDNINISGYQSITTEDFSVCFWMKNNQTLADSDDFYVVMSNKQGTNGTQIGWAIGLHGDINHGLELRINDGGQVNDDVVQLSTDRSALLSDGNWHFCAITADRSGNATLYVDGFDGETGVISGQSNSFANNLNLLIAGYGNGTFPFTGEQKNVIIFDRVLTATEVSNIYNNKSFDYSKIIWNDYNIDGTTLTYSPLNSTQKTNIKNNLKSDGSTSLGLTQLQLDDFGEGNKW